MLAAVIGEESKSTEKRHSDDSDFDSDDDEGSRV